MQTSHVAAARFCHLFLRVVLFCVILSAAKKPGAVLDAALLSELQQVGVMRRSSFVMRRLHPHLESEPRRHRD
jgi:hypothetical protein